MIFDCFYYFFISISIFIVLFNYKKGIFCIVQLLLTIILPILSVIWCKMRYRFAFGGSCLAFFYQTAFVDRMIEPQIIIFGHLILCLLSLYNFPFRKIYKLLEDKYRVKNEQDK